MKNNFGVCYVAINPFVPIFEFMQCMAKILILKYEGIMEKFPMSAASMSR